MTETSTVPETRTVRLLPLANEGAEVPAGQPNYLNGLLQQALEAQIEVSLIVLKQSDALLGHTVSLRIVLECMSSTLGKLARDCLHRKCASLESPIRPELLIRGQ